MGKFDPIPEEISVNVPGKSGAKLTRKQGENNKNPLETLFGGQMNMAARTSRKPCKSYQTDQRYFKGSCSRGSAHGYFFAFSTVRLQ